MEALLTAAGFELEPGFTCKGRHSQKTWKQQGSLVMNLPGSCKNKKIDQADEFYASACFFLLKRCSRIIYLPKVERSNIIELI